MTELQAAPPEPELSLRAVEVAPAAPAAAPAAAVRERALLVGARVLVVSTHYRPETTGWAPYTADLAEHLAAAGAQVRVVTAQPHHPHWRRPEGVANRLTRGVEAGVEVVRVRGYIPSAPTPARRAAYQLAFVLAARPHLLTFRPDVVVACVPSLLAGAAGASVARRFGVPCVTVVQDLASAATERRGLRPGGWAAGVLSRVERATFRRSAQVTVPAAAFAAEIHRLAPGTPVEVLANWSRIADEPTPDNPAAAAEARLSRAAARRRLGWGDRFVVAHAGEHGRPAGVGRSGTGAAPPRGVAARRAGVVRG